MKAHLIDTHLLVPRSRSSAKVKVKYQDHVSQNMGVSGGISISQTHLVFFFQFGTLFPEFYKYLAHSKYSLFSSLTDITFLDWPITTLEMNKGMSFKGQKKNIVGKIEQPFGKIRQTCNIFSFFHNIFKSHFPLVCYN